MSTALKGKGKVVTWLREHANHTGQNCLKYPFPICEKVGYAMFGLNGKHLYAHRFMCELKNGPPPSPRAEAAHTCGNAHMGCVNPNHLVWKTRKGNAQDRLKHGNYSNRKGQPRFLLNAEQAEQIRLLKGQKSQYEIAEMFGVSRCTVSSIHCGRGWTGARTIRIFTDDEVRSIRARRSLEPVAKLAEEFGTSQSAIWRIWNGRTYKHVTQQSDAIR